MTSPTADGQGNECTCQYTEPHYPAADHDEDCPRYQNQCTQVSAEIDAAAALRELLTMRRRNALNAKFRDRPPLPGHELDFVVPAED